MDLQEAIALGIVGITLAAMTSGWWRNPVARWLLKRGKVKWAMRLRTGVDI